jgi:hypothetical protein
VTSGYKFLAAGAMGPISGFRWPQPQGDTPGAWVQAKGPLGLCENGPHLCRAIDLAHWLHDELWQAEIAGEQIAGLDCLVVRGARLVRRIDAWHQGGSERLAHACAQHARELVERAPGATALAAKQLLDDAVSTAAAGFVAVSAYASALAVAKLDAPADQHGAYRRERAWQSEWIARVLIAA